MKVRIAGTGRYVPAYSYDNAFMWDVVGHPKQWTPDRIEQLLGIERRAYAVPIDRNTGKAEREFDEVEMAVHAARQALEAAGREPKDIDMLLYASCTVPDGDRQHFMRGALDLPLRLGLPEHAIVNLPDVGCGGALHAIEHGWEAILSGRKKRVLVVASNCPSQFLDRDLYLDTQAWLSSLIFADGAGAVLLEKSTGNADIIEAVTFVDPTLPLMRMKLHSNHKKRAYFIDAKEVRDSYPVYVNKAFNALRVKVPSIISSDAFIFHQVNAHVLKETVQRIGLPLARVPIIVDKMGNMAAAATLFILDQEIRAGRLGPGALVTICTVGAGAQFGAIALNL